MIDTMMVQNTKQSFFEKYKKWILAIIGIQLIPSILFMSSIIGLGIYFYAIDDSNTPAYKSYIRYGYNTGVKDGDKDHDSNEHIPEIYFKNREYYKNIPWLDYKKETKVLEKAALAEKDEYLGKFPANDRGKRLAGMRTNNIRLPIQRKLEQRFTREIDFFVDYTAKSVSREDYKNDKDYQEALQEKAWEIGYEYGYARGRAFGNFLTRDL
jgi:hypothetical protein